MARRRVNLRFVITLSVVLAVVGGGGAGMLGVLYMRNTDPVRLKQEGDAALAKNPPDIETALLKYQKARGRINAGTPLNGADLSMTIGNLFYQTSDQDPTRYGVAIRWWSDAVMQDKKYKPALERLLKEGYLIAQFSSQPNSSQTNNWQDLEQKATSLIALDEKYGLAYAYRGEAILRQIVNTELTRERREAAQADLNKAMQLLPGEPMAFSLSARLYLQDARQHEIGGRKQEAKKARDEAFALMRGFCDHNPNNATGWALLASLYLDDKQQDEGRKCFETALKVAPNDPKIYEMMGQFLAGRQNDEAEKALKRAVELNPSDAEVRYELATLCQAMHRPTDAIDCYKKVLDLRGTAVGIQGAKMQQLVPASLYALSTLYMETVELMGEAGPRTPAGKDALQQASLYMDKLRGLNTNNPSLYVLDGRMLLIRERNAEALGQLRRAEEILSRDRRNSPQWRTTRLLMATAYARTGETGLAMQCIEEILKTYPGDPGIALQKAKLSLQLQHLDEAIKAADIVLARDPENNDALRTKALALLGQGKQEEYKKIMTRLSDPSSQLAEVRIHVLLGESQDALALLKPILEKGVTEDLTPLRYAIIAYRQLAAKAAAEKKDADAKASVEEAKKLLVQGLAKNPQDTWLQLMLKSLENPETSAKDLELQVIEGIKDPYDRAMAYWQFYAAQGDMKSQLKYLQEAEVAKPEDPQVVERIFAIALGTKDLDLAQKYAQKAERLNLDSVSGKMYLGRLQLVRADQLRAEGKTKEASAAATAGLNTLQSAVLSRPDYSVLRTYYGCALMDAGRTDQARDELEKAVEQQPSNVFALKALIRLSMARGDEASQRAGLAYLKQAMTYARSDPQLIALADMYGDPNEGIQRRAAILKARPDDMENRRQLAMLYVRANNLPLAIETLKPVQEKFPDDLLLADQLARLYRETQQSAVGLKLYLPFLSSQKDAKVQYAALLLQGDMYRSLGQNKEAALLYQNAIQKQPEGINEAQRRFADLCFDTDDLGNAEAQYKKLYQEDKTHDMRILRRCVETLIRESKFDEASAMLADVLKANPRDPQGLVLKGNLLLRQRKADGTSSPDAVAEAIKCFNTVLEDDPNNLHALHYRAFSQFFMLGDTKKAIEDLTRVRQLMPSAVNSRLLLARVYRQSRQYAEAIKEYQETLNLAPTLMQARLELCDFLFTLAESYQRVAPNAQDTYSLQLRTIKPVEVLNNVLNDSVKRFPTQPIWQIQLGELASVIGNKDAAMAIYQKVYQENGRNPQFAAPYLQGLAAQKNYDRVIEEASKILADNPNAVELYVQRGTAYARQTKQTEALADLEKALTLTAKDVPSSLAVVRQFYRALPKDTLSKALQARLTANPQDVPTRVGLGQSLISDGQPSQAVQVVGPLLDDPNAKALRVVTLRMLALAYYQNGEFQKSLTSYEALLKQVPDDLEVLNNLAFLLAEDLKRPADALGYAERAVKVLKSRPMEIAYVNNGNVMDTYGWIKFLNKDEAGAVEELARSLQTDPLPITYYHMAQVLKQQKRIPEAKKNLQLGIELAKQRQDPILGPAEELLRQLTGGASAEGTQK